MNFKKMFYLSLGLIGLALGAVGAAVPMLPAFPFLVLAAFGFGRGSEKLDTWFKSTKLYKDNLESFIKGEGMTKKSKIRIMLTVTAVMSIGFFMMRNMQVGQIILFAVWIFHLLYFWFDIKLIQCE